ncbi:Arc family DNA-binding protein [Klebsiella pneumoniae]|jgi:plasmid stability protein|uniref:Arc family DNA-binding protein n=1 Tax=Klebsiella pneumoniae TaxID=573 RepID=UPI000E2AED10|nr:Arc family DNA-binding protein [Klebsiella pneumoniae]MBQ5098364.1 Arc family DNA-binding protein [Klebsiella pneumoniae]WQO23525.1 Arc family DNA-binding protein [Klebsiella pneumoniae subsp. pneumoniae]SWM02890.1 Arc-like DNA binding domain protein [Klebsiella pneumoniae]HBY6105594.1 Arc family DNA-binding protein [Klebsiella pneumoniae]HED2225408.1 Arc family DNA-binding protein [Klebsiella pneumoniae]
MSDKPVREYDKFMLRFPDGMRDAIAERAKRNGRSMNSEIIQIIEDVLKTDKNNEIVINESDISELSRVKPETMEALVDAIEKNEQLIKQMKAVLKKAFHG